MSAYIGLEACIHGSMCLGVIIEAVAAPYIQLNRRSELPDSLGERPGAPLALILYRLCELSTTAYCYLHDCEAHRGCFHISTSGSLCRLSDYRK